ncbi:MAG TPA: aminodeoxychorismate synthase component I [Gammaproteobacteria bacterium]|nr:aminodeoxychorismate synthase component I [Gammaproteobacteria bacterium]
MRHNITQKRVGRMVICYATGIFKKSVQAAMIEEIPFNDPEKIISRFAEQNGAIFLDSAMLTQHSGRYSFIALDPFLILSSKNGLITLGDETFFGNPLDVLLEQLSLFPLEKKANLPPFQGGVAGFFSYDLVRHLEKLPEPDIDDMQFPDMMLGFYDLVIGFDLHEKRAWIFSSGYPEKDLIKREKRARDRLAGLLDLIETIPDLPPVSSFSCLEKNIQSNFSKDSYQMAVKKVIEHILSGDIFEANISQRFRAELPADFSAFDLYRKLRALNPAPFSAFLNFRETQIVSASPERFLRLIDRFVEARPIKGTRPRSHCEKKDAELASELLASEKDTSENVMIVDLLRNDLSRVCQDHSVRVPQLCGLESYATVHHLVSVITGELQDELSAVDLLRATFPGGSITGAPKIRSMEIIQAIEKTARGPYCGSIGYIGFHGDMDLSITIRTFAIKNHIAIFQAGGAIVLDSEPLAEYEETLTKARALFRALVE